MRGGRWCGGLAAAALLASTGAAAQQPPPPPTLRVTPNCSDARPSELLVRFTGTLLVPGGDVLIYFDLERDDRTVARDVLAEDYTFDTRGSVSPEASPGPDGAYLVTAVQPRRPNDPVTATFRVPCPAVPSSTTTTSPLPPRSTTTTTTPGPGAPVRTPTLTMNPPLGRPGFVATATGRGWPAGPVTIGWTAGGEPIAAVADGDGSFSVPVVVLPGITLGPQGVLGLSPGGATATGAFLVVPHSAGPPTWNH